MASTHDLEQRLAALEAEVAELKRRPTPVAAADWLDRITGSIKDAEAFEEINRLGRAIRAADRPPEEKEAAP